VTAPTVTLSWRGLLTNKVRFLLTAVAVVLGVGFVTGSFVLADSLKNVFSNLFTEINQGVDVQVRTAVAFGQEGTGTPVPANLVDRIKAVPGVANAVGTASDPNIVIIGPDGKAKTPAQAPTLGVSWADDPQITPLRLSAGNRPEGIDQVALDVNAAKKSGYHLGDTVTVLLPSGQKQFQLVGTFTFGSANSLAGAYLVAWDTRTASAILPTNGGYTSIDVRAEPGVNRAELRDRVASVLPSGVEAIDNQTLNSESQDQVAGFINAFGTALLVFAGVAVFVSTFIINNTFGILLGQRIRELAMLRAIGASAKQVRRMVLGEALAVAALASAAGIGVGVLIAVGIRALINGLGGGLPSGGIVITARTIIVALLVGFGVTLLSALRPALRAGTVPPIAAISGHWDRAHVGLGRRVAGATALSLVGLALLVWALFARPGSTPAMLSICGLGAILLFLGVAGLSHLVARPVIGALGRPLDRLFKISGRLARENASRNPRRTASTASALMIGLALVTAISVLGASVKHSVSESLHSSISADLLVTGQNNGASFSPAVLDAVRNVPGVAGASGLSVGQFQVDGSTKSFVAADTSVLGQLIDIGVTRGNLAELGTDEVFVHKDPAKDLHLQVGSPVQVTFPSTGSRTFHVAGIFDDSSVIGSNWVVNQATYEEGYPNRPGDILVAARFAPGVDAAKVHADVASAVQSIAPQLKVQNKAEFQKSTQQQIDTLIAVVNALLALAVIISMIGIANPLALSVYERIREFGLLRAVGMTRRQMRRMVRWEAALVALFGALIGVVVGLVLGLLVAWAVPAAFIKAVQVPVGQLVLYVVAAIVAGLIAARGPARKAARLNVLDAIAHE
jgi:putative ABC transport system permease protein